MSILKQIWNWLLGKTSIDEKVHEAKESVTEKIAETKKYIKNVEEKASDLVDAVVGKEEPEVAPQSEEIAEPVAEECKAFETPVVKPKPKKKYYKKKTAKKEK